MDPAGLRAPDRVWRWLIGGVLVAYAAAAFYGRQRGIFWGGDDADYALLARALRSLRYDDLFLVGTPPHTTYPPVYPLLLSLWGSVFGDAPATLSVLGIALMTGALALVAHLAAVHASTRFAFVAVFLMAVNPHLLTTGGRLLSEAAMIFFAAATLWLLDRRPGRAGVALAIATAVLCALTRTAGGAVVLAAGAFWLLRRRLGAVLALAAVATVCLGAWFLWTTQETDDAFTYASRLAAYKLPDAPLWRTLPFSLTSKIATAAGSQLPEALGLPLTGSTWLDNLAWVPLTLAMVVGCWIIGRRIPSVGLFLVAYALVLLVWPFTELRLLVPILPVLLPAGVIGAAAIARRVRPAAARPAAIAVALVLVASGTVHAARALSCDGSIFSRTPQCVREGELAVGRAIDFVRRQAPREAVVMARGEVLHYYTGNLTVPYPDVADIESEGADRVLTGVDYILISTTYAGINALSLLAERACRRLTVVHSEPPHTWLLRVHPPDAGIANDACRAVREELVPLREPPDSAPARAAPSPDGSEAAGDAVPDS